MKRYCFRRTEFEDSPLVVFTPAEVRRLAHALDLGDVQWTGRVTRAMEECDDNAQVTFAPADISEEAVATELPPER